MQIKIEAHALHAQRIEDAWLAIDDELAAQQMKDFAIRGPFDGPRTIDGGANVLAVDFALAIAQIESTPGIQPANMRSANAHHALVDVQVR